MLVYYLRYRVHASDAPSPTTLVTTSNTSQKPASCSLNGTQAIDGASRSVNDEAQHSAGEAVEATRASARRRVRALARVRRVPGRQGAGSALTGPHPIGVSDA